MCNPLWDSNKDRNGSADTDTDALQYNKRCTPLDLSFLPRLGALLLLLPSVLFPRNGFMSFGMNIDYQPGVVDSDSKHRCEHINDGSNLLRPLSRILIN